jgi:hypothetical protein
MVLIKQGHRAETNWFPSEAPGILDSTLSAYPEYEGVLLVTATMLCLGGLTRSENVGLSRHLRRSLEIHAS